ncbi:ATP-dependent DNA helicase PIF1 [Colletotrichum salicis]|uniref:ATP-dependent DNA helicase PIF1 n=1 Tax=Colletotrichum salicis TaxID=1209931 RepID=A0A135U192_9PEZI|nr:ATP-dependent DNA helicase PIF1 [Colletotrichum salicis]
MEQTWLRFHGPGNTKRTDARGGFLHTPSPKRHQAQTDARPSVDPPQTSIDDQINALVEEYTWGVPRQLGGKKAKYYVVWNGNKCGIFTDWLECKASVSGVSGQGFKSAPTYEKAVTRLRERLTGKLEAERQSVVPQQRPQDTWPPPYTSQPQYPLQPRDTPQNTHLSTPQHPPATPSNTVPGDAAPSNVAANTVNAGEPQALGFEPAPDPREPPLCQEQQAAMDLAMAGHNLCRIMRYGALICILCICLWYCNCHEVCLLCPYWVADLSRIRLEHVGDNSAPCVPSCLDFQASNLTTFSSLGA